MVKGNRRHLRRHPRPRDRWRCVIRTPLVLVNGQGSFTDSGTKLTDNGVRPYRSSPGPYNGVSPEQRAARETRGKRSIEFGAAWLIGGLLVTVITHEQAQGAVVYVVTWGPTLYGIFRIVSGCQLLSRSRESR